MNSTQRCGFDGNPDIYGVGIRIGYYTQILSVWIANYFVLHESKSLREVNTLFMLALFIGLAWQSRRPAELYAIEAFVLLQLVCATWYVGVLEKSRYSRKYWRFSPVRLIVRNGTLVALLSYSVWFWWVGLDHMKPTPCGTWMFFVAKVNLFGWYRSAFKVLSIVAIGFHAILTVGHVAQVVQHWLDKKALTPEYYRRLRDELLQHDERCQKTVTGSSQERGGDGKETDSLEFNQQPASTNPSSANPSSANHTEAKGDVPPLLAMNPQPSSSQRPSSPIENPANHPTTSQLPSLSSLLAAEAYLNLILNHSQPRQTTTYRIPYTPISLSLPSLPPIILPQGPLRLPLLIPLALHIYSLRTHNISTYPFLLHRALLSPHHPTLPPLALTTAIALRTATLPLATTPKPYLVFSAASTLFVVVGLVLAVELSVRWNQVRHMGDVGTVGQLVPAVLGIGGLLKVMWGFWTRGNGKGSKVAGVGEEGVVVGEARECAEVWERIKKGLGEGNGGREEVV